MSQNMLANFGMAFFSVVGLLFVFMLATFSLGAADLFSLQSTFAEGAEIEIEIEVEPELLKQFEQAQKQGNSQVGYLIYFRASADLSPASEMDWEARGQLVMNALQTTAEASQRKVRAYLDSRGVEPHYKLKGGLKPSLQAKGGLKPSLQAKRRAKAFTTS